MGLKVSSNHWRHFRCVCIVIFRDESFGWSQWVSTVWGECCQFDEAQIYRGEYFCESEVAIEESRVLVRE